jgi:hypothetical protein
MFKSRSKSLSGVIVKLTVLLSPGASAMRLKSFNSNHGASHGAHQLADVELNDFIARALASVRDGYASARPESPICAGVTFRFEYSNVV